MTDEDPYAELVEFPFGQAIRGGIRFGELSSEALDDLHRIRQTDDHEPVEGVLDEMSAYFGPFAKPHGITLTFTKDEISPEARDILFGIADRIIEGEVVQGEVTDGRPES